MHKINRLYCIFTVMICLITCSFQLHAHPADENIKLKIGVTLHPYYSYVKNIVKDRADVIPIIGAGFNPHNYRPQPDDIKRLTDDKTKLDVLVVNGIGHDEFAFQMLKAAKLEGKLPLIYANTGVALIPIAGISSGEKIVNPHTFIGISSSIQQVYNIAKALGKIDKKNAKFYRQNARNYARKLRRIKSIYMNKLSDLPDIDFRCATLHGGYDYLLQEFGLQVTAVIEPKHGIKPSGIELADTIQKIKDSDISVVFTEMDFPDKVVDTIQKETGIKVRTLSHLTAGEYTRDSFEIGMKKNLHNLSAALIDAANMKEETNVN